MENNFNQEINKINMETSKKLAESMQNWGGVNNSLPPVASSFLNGSTSQMIKESVDNDYSPKPKQKTSFSFGVVNTISALKNTSLYDIPQGKLMLEKYEYLLFNKGISEAFLVEGLVNDLKSFSWENSVVPVLENISKVLDGRRREIEVVKAYESIKNTAGKEIFSDATKMMGDWLISESRSSDSLIHGLRRYGFNPIVRNLVSFLAVYESQNSDKFYVGASNQDCEVENIYSPIHVNEKESIFFSSGKFLKVDEETKHLSECQMDEVPMGMQDKAAMMMDRDVKVSDNKIVLNIGGQKVEIVFEGESKNFYFNGKKINESDLPTAINATTNNLLENSNLKINKALFVSKASEEIIDIDFGKRVKSKVYEGVEANIFRSGDKIYVQTVNPMMKLNKIYEANATQAINIVKDFIKFDISESLTEFLDGEKAILSVLKNDKAEAIKNIGILEGELRKIENAKASNSLIKESAELKELAESIEREILLLKDKWNQINLEINKFENGANQITPGLNEDLGYPIDTEVRIKRNGVKGKVIGVDGNSKTYTIMFKEGKTGEYFFSDVEDLGDEVEKVDIQSPEMELEFTDSSSTAEAPTNESEENFAEAPEESGSSHYDKAFMAMVKKHMSEAPSKESKGSSKFIDDEKNSNMSEAPESKFGSSVKSNKIKNQLMASAPEAKAGKGKNFVDDLSNLNLAEAPSANIKGSSKFIEDLKNQNLAIKESQKNSHIEKAPKAKSEKVKKFIEDEEDANLEEAPGDHKKNGKKFVEDINRANLSSAPKAKKK